MPKILVCLLILTFCYAGHPARAQEPLDPVISKLDDEVEEFLEEVAKGNEELAFEHLLLGSRLHTQTEAIKQMVTRAEQLERTYGQFQEVEQISSKRVGRDLVLLKYLFKCKDFPVVWYFTYYRDFNSRSLMSDVNTWIVISVKFDTELEELAKDK